MNVPVQEMVTITEQKAHKVQTMVPTQVLTEVWETIADPPCHWHFETHSHANNDASSGKKHEHAIPSN